REPHLSCEYEECQGKKMALAIESRELGIYAESGIGKTPPSSLLEDVLPNTGHATRCGMARSRTCAGAHTLEILTKPIRGRHRQRSISTTRLDRSRTSDSHLSPLRTSGEWVVHHPLLFWNVRNSLSVRHIDH